MKADQDLTDVLASLALFADLSRPQIEAVAHTCEEVSFPQGQRVLRQGFSHPDFYLIVEGEAEVRIDGVSRTKLGRGDFFGEVAVLLDEPATADVVSLTFLRCMTLPGSDLHQLLVSFPELMFRMLKVETGRLRQTLEWRP
ncbi:MAG TPA: cyclic nucleotide-binding domain-containing protein [Actinomycetota bacterium]|nr:cyclic nucleotide-binding domain-containing protein [Actinomycetota bacterium]